MTRAYLKMVESQAATRSERIRALRSAEDLSIFEAHKRVDRADRLERLADLRARTRQLLMRDLIDLLIEAEK